MEARRQLDVAVVWLGVAAAIHASPPPTPTKITIVAAFTTTNSATRCHPAPLLFPSRDTVVIRRRVNQKFHVHLCVRVVVGELDNPSLALPPPPPSLPRAAVISASRATVEAVTTAVTTAVVREEEMGALPQCRSPR